MVLGLQNSRGRLVLKLTIEQPRQACFKASYKRKKAGGDGGFSISLQQQSSSYACASDEEEEEAEAPELVSTC